MNKFFSTIGQELPSNFKTLDHAANIPNINIDTCITDIHISEDKFNDKFRKLKPGKAHDADEITSREMKIVGEELGNSIANITRSNITRGKYPSQWKIGKVKTIYKSGKKEIYGHYRPLTVLSIPSKVSEVVICESLGKHLAKDSQSNQWGFKKSLSTESLLLYLTETWKYQIENGKVIGAIFIDFTKAFDSVNHSILTTNSKLVE